MGGIFERIRGYFSSRWGDDESLPVTEIRRLEPGTRARIVGHVRSAADGGRFFVNDGTGSVIIDLPYGPPPEGYDARVCVIGDVAESTRGWLMLTGRRAPVLVSHDGPPEPRRPPNLTG